eukprot:TRINITY_DN5245_c0_g1_i1.p1 TRINITY_DN5245_c0_g1~~TRINITY_DN5245_c0_g1_i1.p1  ORF type:complete len:665 (-),score=127.13 TRINITY_DN5245_c0_g1_i1:44-2038(-)
MEKDMEDVSVTDAVDDGVDIPVGTPEGEGEGEVEETSQKLINYVNLLPTELLCLVFTLLNSRTDIRNVSLVCIHWNNALTVEAVWRSAYIRFYGEVSTPLIEENIRSWSQLFRRRAGQNGFIYRLTRNPRLHSISDQRILDCRLIGGKFRSLVVQIEKNHLPQLVHLSTGDIIPIEAGDMFPSYTFISPDGKRIAFGNSQGVVEVYSYEKSTKLKKTPSLKRTPTRSFQKIATYSDGHNLPNSGSRTIEYIAENSSYMATVANNNTVAIWNKNVEGNMYACGYTLKERNIMRDELEEYDSRFETAELWRRAEIEREDRANAIRKVAAEIERERKEAEIAGEEPEQRNPHRYGLRQDAMAFLDGELVLDDREVPTLVPPAPAVEDEGDAEPRRPVRVLPGGRRRREREVAVRKDSVYVGTMGVEMVRSILEGSSSQLKIKSMVFKYPPSVVYAVPGESLQFVFGLQNGNILVWHALGSYTLKAHKTAIDHALAFVKDDETYLISVSSRSLEMSMWNITPTSTVTRDGREKMMCKVKLTAPVRGVDWSEAHECIILETAKSVLVWDLYTPGALRQSSSAQILFLLYSITREDATIASILLIDRNSLLLVQYSDSISQIYFLPTGQMVGENSALNQYFTPFTMLLDEFTFAQVDDSGIYWKNLVKWY